MTDSLVHRSTDSFIQFLQREKITIGVTTYQAGKLVLISEKQDELNTRSVRLAKPMGVALDGDRLSVGAGPKVVHYYNMPKSAHRVEPPDDYDACFIPRAVHITSEIDIHEMSFDQSGELWCVNTKMSCLCTLSTPYSVVPRWKPPFITGYDLSDRCHLNGLAMKEGKPGWVTALGTTDTAAGWRENKASGGMLMEVATGKMTCNDLSMPHSPRWHNGELWLLESGTGSLLKINPENGKRELVAELPGFCRGLDFVGGYAVIGLSKARETSNFEGLALADRVTERLCGIFIVDTASGQIVASLVFSDAVQEIFAVTSLPMTFPAVLDINHPLIHTTYSLPDETSDRIYGTDETRYQRKRALALYKEGKREQAIATWRELFKKDPKDVNSYYLAGVALCDLAQWREAVETLITAIKLQPEHARAHNRLGQAWTGLQKDDNALYHYQRAVESDPQYAPARYNKGLLLLRQGRYQAAWPEFEWRYKLPGYALPQWPQPRWQGEDIRDKVLLVRTERNDSEAILFARFLPLVAKRCRRLIVACTELLQPVFDQVEGVHETKVTSVQPATNFDFYCSIMSLGNLLKIDENNLRPPTPYLQLGNGNSVKKLGDTGRLKVGLAWTDTFNEQGKKSPQACPLDSMIPLAQCENAEFFSLQNAHEDEDRAVLDKSGITDLTSEIADYTHIGKFAEQMDLVISVSAPVAHLSATLSIPTWVLLTQNSDWCWQRDRVDSPWYPQVTIFRQNKPGDWGELINRVKRELALL